ncbi:oxalate:formate antiporter-like isoform X1 [Haliotis rufescens]|uniref:oxalate:formate antiporter-like isoform X1 n=1 Tax=Haliotis rufescens TaxID=6454 RepID=UPI00201EDA48|nr:oxalate:formate antiporter-like isoform X1 [Haliotis rufescens]
MACWIGWPATRVIIGGVLIHITLGTLYTFGNLNPYLTSYLREEFRNETLYDYSDTAWVYSASIIGMGCTIVLAGAIYDRLGPRVTVAIGCVLMSGGTLLTALTIEHSIYLVVLTYGLMFGLGVGISYTVPMSCAMKWIPQRKGLACGLTVAGFGGGAFIFDYVQTWYINPDNEYLDNNSTTQNFFTQEAILNRVPRVFSVLGACYAALQVMGIILLTDPPNVQQIEGEEENVREEMFTDSGEREDRRMLEESSSLLQETPNMTSASLVEEAYVSWRHSWKTKDFWLLWFALLLNSQGLVFFSSFWKAYGLSIIRDDHFLAIVGSVAALFNAGGRIFWGHFGDKVSFKVAMLYLCAVFTVLMASYQLNELAGKPLFFIYVCLTFGTFCGNYALFPVATVQTFGQRHFVQNYGLLFTSQSVMALILAITSDEIRTGTDTTWEGLFYLSAACSFCCFLLMIALKKRRPFE